ncbi:hypothetical protein EI94DRAFT_1708745 [Lactarius quietus]|nr:hypothetical protein EI94DRAFT_1708745 [Lactarius quietus]
MIAEVKKKLAALSHGKDNEDTEGKREELEDKIVKEKGKIAAGKKWAVRVYNREAIEANPPDLANAIFRFISRNEVKVSMRATPEKHMLEVVNDLRDAYKKDQTPTNEENSKQGVDKAIIINTNSAKHWKS